MKGTTLYALCVFTFLIVGCVVNIPDPTATLPLIEKKISGEGGKKILIIEISGTISRMDYIENIQGKQKINLVSRVKEELELAKRDDNIRALILLIDSPGGEVTASDLIYHELRKFKREKKIPIISNIVSVGASGSYYVAMVSDKIVAQPTSIVGSIGVIINSVNIKRLMDKIGVDNVTYKSGKYKDLGSPLKPVVAEETKILLNIIKYLHHNFIEIVMDGRQLSRQEVEQIADGSIFTPVQAKNKGLIDSIGYIDDSIKLAKQLAHLTSASIIMYQRGKRFQEQYL